MPQSVARCASRGSSGRLELDANHEDTCGLAPPPHIHFCQGSPFVGRVDVFHVPAVSLLGESLQQGGR